MGNSCRRPEVFRFYDPKTRGAPAPSCVCVFIEKENEFVFNESSTCVSVNEFDEGSVYGVNKKRRCGSTGCGLWKSSYTYPLHVAVEQRSIGMVKDLVRNTDRVA